MASQLSTCFQYLMMTCFAILLLLVNLESTTASVIPSSDASSLTIDQLLAAASTSEEGQASRVIPYLPLKDPRVLKHLKQKPNPPNQVDPRGDEPQAERILQLLLARLGIAELPGHTERPEVNRHIAEICGQSATLTCGKMAVQETGMGHKDLGAKCDARKAFLYCIEDARADCKSKILNQQRYPILPPLDQIEAFQRLVKHSLWTGGGCLLAY